MARSSRAMTMGDALALMVKSSLGPRLRLATGGTGMDHSKRLIVFAIVASAIIGYLTLDALLSPQQAPAGPSAPAVTPQGQ